MDKKKIIFIAISVFVCLLVYIPTPRGIDPQEYSPGKTANFQALGMSKDKLGNAEYIFTPAEGAEDIEIDNQGFVYSGLHDGSIIKIKPDNSELEVVAKSEGHIFGLDLNKKGDKLAIADQVSGIKILDLNTGQFEHLVSEYEGVKFQSPNAVVFDSKDENLYFTVSSQKIPMSDFHEMLLYSQGSGRIFSYNLNSKQTELLADNLYFVNGLQYSAKDNCLYYIETSRSRLSKLDLSPEKRGNTTLVLGNILGYPDNVKLSQSGDLWVAIPALRDSFSNIIDHNSLIRRVLINLRIPLGGFMTLANMKYAGGIKVNPQTKEIVEYFFGSSDHIDCVSGINEKNGKLYLSSLSKNKIAVVNTIQIEKKVEESSNKVQQVIPADKKQTLQDVTIAKAATQSQKTASSKQQKKIQQVGKIEEAEKAQQAQQTQKIEQTQQAQAQSQAQQQTQTQSQTQAGSKSQKSAQTGEQVQQPQQKGQQRNKGKESQQQQQKSKMQSQQQSKQQQGQQKQSQQEEQQKQEQSQKTQQSQQENKREKANDVNNANTNNANTDNADNADNSANAAKSIKKDSNEKQLNENKQPALQQQQNTMKQQANQNQKKAQNVEVNINAQATDSVQSKVQKIAQAVNTETIKQKILETVEQQILQTQNIEVQNAQILKQMQNQHPQQAIDTNIQILEETAKQEVRARTTTTTTKATSKSQAKSATGSQRTTSDQDKTGTVTGGKEKSSTTGNKGTSGTTQDKGRKSTGGNQEETTTGGQSNPKYADPRNSKQNYQNNQRSNAGNSYQKQNNYNNKNSYKYGNKGNKKGYQNSQL